MLCHMDGQAEAFFHPLHLAKGLGGLVEQLNLCDAVYAQMGDVMMPVIVANQVVPSVCHHHVIGVNQVADGTAAAVQPGG